MGKKKILLLIAGAVLILLAAGLIIGNTLKKRAESQITVISAEDIKVGKNEKLLSGTISYIAGNEITLTGYDESDGEAAKDMVIPVGTQVTTRLGTVTTFSRLASGDQVTLLVQSDTEDILSVWITGQN